MRKIKLLLTLIMVLPLFMSAQIHSTKNIRYPNYNGLVMCGYQGWFRANGDAANRGWGHYGVGNQFDPEHVTIDLWPDVSEYEVSYETAFINSDGSFAKVFSPLDASTVDLHFKWMEEYGIDGVFMQRFFGTTRNENTRKAPDMVLMNALAAAQNHQRAVAVMYDLSGLNPSKDDCTSLITDWKHLVDDLKITNQGDEQFYLHHHNKPLVAIWGVGFPDRPYDIHKIKLEELIDFLQNDPVYGGCTVMLGVPAFFRELNTDCIHDDYLHTIIKKADLVMPWMVGRFSMSNYADMDRYAVQVQNDLEWCKQHHVDYVPCIYPGFSWYNLSKIEFGGKNPLNQIPRYGGDFYWKQIFHVVKAGAQMIYVAMFDEIDEGTAIFKCTNRPPVNGKFVDLDGESSDFYLKLTGLGRKMLRQEIPLEADFRSFEETKK